MKKQELLEENIHKILDNTPEYKLFHVKPLYIQVQIINNLLTTFINKRAVLRKQNNSIKKSLKKDKSNKRQVVLQELSQIAYLLNHLDGLVNILIQEALLSSNKNKNTDHNYRYKARFKNLTSNLHKVKGYSLLCKYGFYNRVNNPDGCVLDHRVSIKFGKDNNISPEVLGHLANCEFLLYKDNIKKSSNCSISLEQLKKEISNFDDISIDTI